MASTPDIESTTTPALGEGAGGRPSIDAVLEVEDIVVRYGRSVIAVDGVSLQVGRGECVGLVGPNGAGKTTVVRSICGFLPMEPGRVIRGRVRFAGEDVTRRSPRAMARLGVQIVPERDKVFPALTVEDHLLLAGGLRENDSDLPAGLSGLLKRSKVRASELSGGQKQMLGLICAVAARPKLLLVDEFTLGLAPVVVREVMDVIAWMRESLGVTVLAVEQNVAVAREMAERMYVMRAGKCIWSGPSAELRDDITESGYFG